MSKLLVPAIAAALLVCAPALAAKPIISGNYAVTHRTFCQIVQTVDSATGQTTSTDPGEIIELVAQLNFNSKKKTFVGSGVRVYGSSLVLKFSDGTQTGDPFAQQSTTPSGTYSNTATTVTLTFSGSPTEILPVVYGQMNTSGVAESFSLIYTDMQNCAQDWQATLQ